MAFYLIVQQFAAVLQKQIIGGSAQQRKRVFKFEYSKFVGSCSAIMEGIRIFRIELFMDECVYCGNTVAFALTENQTWEIYSELLDPIKSHDLYFCIFD